MTIVLLLASACSEPPTASSPASSPTLERARDPDAIERGRRIYMTGKSPSGAAIEAVLAGDVVADAATLPCVGCHGEDGRGRPEGGMTPSNITWEQLGKPYGGRSQAGREHPAYTPESLRKAITMGIDPSGNQLLPTMPRHRMSLADMDSLIAYLETLGEHHAIGIDDQTITLVTVAPVGPPTTAELVLLAYFAEVDARGGVFGRRLELEVLRLDGHADADALVEQLASAWTAAPGFAVIAPQLGHAEPELLRWFADAGVPVIGPATRYPEPGTPPRPSVFYVDGGVPAQARALAEFMLTLDRSASASPRGVVVFPDREPERALGQALLEIWRPAGIDAQALAVGELETGPALSDRLVALAPTFIVFLGPAELGLEVLTPLGDPERLATPPWIGVPGSLAIGDPFSLPTRLDGRLFAAYPWLPDDLTPASSRDFQALAAGHGLPAADRPTQIATLAAATILLEGLTRAGRAITRDVLIDDLEGLREFSTGLTPAITYGPNQHIGLHDPRIVRFDLELARLTRVEASP